jgi:predicted nucleic acid binding AN1-type Zn finger protein
MKCAMCKKKLSAVTFTCACEKTFCVTCRLPEDHACAAQVKVSVVLPPAVIAPKVQKI